MDGQAGLLGTISQRATAAPTAWRSNKLWVKKGTGQNIDGFFDAGKSARLEMKNGWRGRIYY
jgi:hypothetical protein